MLDGNLGAHEEAAASGAVGLEQTLAPVDEAGGGEVRPLDDGQNLFELGLGLFHQQNGGGDNLGEIVGRDVGGHADGDSIGAVDEQGGNARGQDGGLDRGVVEVGDEVDRVLVDVGQQLGGDGGEAGFGVTVGGGRIAIDGAEVSLAVDEAVAQGKILRHAHGGVVDRGVAVRMVFAQDLADDLGALDVLAIVQQAHVMHGVENAPMDRLQSVADVGQGAANDDRHRIVEIRAPHLLFNVDGLYV